MREQERFEALTFPVTECGCWIWVGRLLIGHGYGLSKVDGKTIRAHRLAWMIYRGPIPDGLSVLHTCDVRCCVNPDHLYVGTQADNMRDKRVRGRAARRLGEENTAAKLTVTQVHEIIASSEMGKVLAARYGVSKTTISQTRRGNAWRHVHQDIQNKGVSP